MPPVFLQSVAIRLRGNFLSSCCSFIVLLTIIYIFSHVEDAAQTKKQRCDAVSEGTEDSLFELLAKREIQPPATKSSFTAVSTSTLMDDAESVDSAYSQSMKSFRLQRQAEEDEVEQLEVTPEDVLPFLPMDWSVKSKLRILSTTPIVASNLKTNQTASGLSCFVRGIDMESTSTSLDSSLGAQIHQGTFYWQHPHIPWMTLYPRNSKDNGKIILGEMERQALAKGWTQSFQSLFQLVRSRQCPYFYVCANTFTALFRAAGIGGMEETHVIVSPTTRGFRQALKDLEIEFTMPLKVKEERSSTSNEEQGKSSTNDDSGTQADLKVNGGGDGPDAGEEENSDDDDDLGEEQWLKSLGVEADQIQEITRLDQRRQNRKNLDTDTNDQSAILIEGFECQSFFNFLFNSKSTTVAVGRLAGVPPTLLAPVAFLGATLNHVQTRTSKVRMGNVDYHSLELRGVILPHILPQFNTLLRGLNRPNFSASMVNHMDTLPLTKVAIKMMKKGKCKSRRRIICHFLLICYPFQCVLEPPTDDSEAHKQHTDTVFGQENLSDCGLNSRVVANMCRSGEHAVRVLERMCFNTENGGYTFL